MPVTIEDVGVCKKKLSFEIPRDEINAKMDTTVDELARTAQIPGFRPGHAPRRLVQRKLRDEIAEKVKSELIGDVYKAAVDEHKLDVLREEEFDPAKVELPDDGPLLFEVEVEVKPEIEPPDISAIEVEVPRLDVSEQDAEQAVDNLRRSRGRFVEQKKSAKAAERDMLTADVRVTAGGETLLDQTGATLAVFPQSLAGIHLDTIVKDLTGKKVGDTVTLTATVPEDHENEAARGQEAEVTVAIKSVRRIELPPLDDEFAKSVGMATADDVEKAVRERLESDLADARQTARRDAVAAWLLEKVPLEVPAGVAEANAGRVFNNQVVSLQRRGVPLQQIQDRAEELLESCRRRAQRDLKLAFIIAAIAKKESIEATEEEVQARVELIARNYGRPADRVYEDLQRQGYLEALREQTLDDKVYQVLLSKAKVTEVEPPKPEAADEEKAPKAAGKKAGKSAKTPARKKPTSKKARSTAAAKKADDDTTTDDETT